MYYVGTGAARHDRGCGPVLSPGPSAPPLSNHVACLCRAVTPRRHVVQYISPMIGTLVFIRTSHEARCSLGPFSFFPEGRSVSCHCRANLRFARGSGGPSQFQLVQVHVTMMTIDHTITLSKSRPNFSSPQPIVFRSAVSGYEYTVPGSSRRDALMELKGAWGETTPPP